MHVNLARVPLATTSLIVINIIILAAGLLSGSQVQIIRNYGFIPDNVFHITNIDRSNNNPTISDTITRLFSSMFIHTGIAHLAFNILALGYLGGYAERSVGIPRYVLIYILAGIAGALFHSVIASYILGSGHVILIGASGAISGVLGIAAAAGNARAYYWLILQIVFAIFGSFAAIPIAFTAHIGGFIAGVFLTKLFIGIERKKRAKYLRPSGDNNYDTWWGK
ncbi:MAG: rhomboid family intramembrane serine protease [Candidatus Nitrosopolaris sp.]|jgi:rhomboid protease GluP